MERRQKYKCTEEVRATALDVAHGTCYPAVVIVSFADAETEDLFNGASTKRARRRLPVALWTIAARKLDMLDAAAVLTDLRVPPGNHLEALTRDRAGQHSVRINDQYRVCFVWTDAGPASVEVTDYH